MNQIFKRIFICLTILIFVLTPMTIDAAPAKELSARTAKLMAKRKVGGGTVIKCRRDYDDGRWEYELVVVRRNRKYEMDIGIYDRSMNDFEMERIVSKTRAKNGKINNYRKNGKSVTSTSTQITAARASQIAQRKIGGGVVTKCKLDREDGRMVYEVEIIHRGLEYEFEIDAATGAILSYDYESVYDD